jgi:hypothetical protein
MCEKRPGHPRVLVCQGARGTVLPPSGHEGSEPSTALIRFGLHPAERGSGPVDEPCPSRDMPPRADPEESGLTQ